MNVDLAWQDVLAIDAHKRLSRKIPVENVLTAESK